MFPVSRRLQAPFWLQGHAAAHHNAYESIAAFSATDFRDDLKNTQALDPRNSLARG
jgi:hypothetical protein